MDRDAYYVNKNKKLGIEKRSLFCFPCWDQKLQEISNVNESKDVKKYKKKSLYLLAHTEIVLGGIVEDLPQCVAYGTGHESVHANFLSVFPMQVNQIVFSYKDIEAIPLKENDVIMIEYNGMAYLQKGHQVEIEGTLERRTYEYVNNTGFVFQARKLINLTYNYSRDY